MRFLAILMVTCILFLSAFAGVDNREQTAPKDCCKKMSAMACHNQPEKKPKKDCNQADCNMLFSCSLCGFLVMPVVKIQDLVACQIQKPVAKYIPGNLAGYSSSNWKPPKLC